LVTQRNRAKAAASRRGAVVAFIAPDLSHTEEAFRVDLAYLAPGAFLTVSVRHPAADDPRGGGDIAVVRAHLPVGVGLVGTHSHSRGWQSMVTMVTWTILAVISGMC
jgi:hypothetical protein